MKASLIIHLIDTVMFRLWFSHNFLLFALEEKIWINWVHLDERDGRQMLIPV